MEYPGGRSAPNTPLNLNTPRYTRQNGRDAGACKGAETGPGRGGEFNYRAQETPEIWACVSAFGVELVQCLAPATYSTVCEGYN